MLCPIKVTSNTIELTVYTSCYCGLDLHCVTAIHWLIYTTNDAQCSFTGIYMAGKTNNSTYLEV